MGFAAIAVAPPTLAAKAVEDAVLRAKARRAFLSLVCGHSVDGLPLEATPTL